VEDGLDRAGLDDPAEVHHHHVVGQLGDHAQVVGDQQDGQPGPLLQVAQQVEDLRLGGHVERRRRLVRDQQAGASGEGHGDHRSLADAPAELVGVLLQPSLGAGHARQPEQFDRPLAGRRRRHPVVQADGLGDLVADGVHRTEGGHRLLEHQRHVAPPDGPHLPPLGVEAGQVALGPVGEPEDDLPPHDAPRALDDAQDGAGGDALAAAALADEAERPAGVDVEARPVHRQGRPVRVEEGRPQVAHREEGRPGGVRRASHLRRRRDHHRSHAVRVGGVA
jgi:hypothetical protein